MCLICIGRSQLCRSEALRRVMEPSAFEMVLGQDNIVERSEKQYRAGALKIDRSSNVLVILSVLRPSIVR